MSSQRIYKLVLHPKSSEFALSSWEGVITRLQEAEFLEKPVDQDNDKRFLVGERFLQYVTFMGCSPSVELSPPADGSLDFCHVRLSDTYVKPQFRCATQNVFARCPRCGKRITHWQQAVSAWLSDSSAVNFQCDKCAARVSLYQLGWRHTAGFARKFMDIYSIYPQEGIPTDQLLVLMETQTKTPWDYFFTDQ
jgi:hypothetical protein